MIYRSGTYLINCVSNSDRFCSRNCYQYVVIFGHILDGETHRARQISRTEVWTTPPWHMILIQPLKVVAASRFRTLILWRSSKPTSSLGGLALTIISRFALRTCIWCRNKRPTGATKISWNPDVENGFGHKWTLVLQFILKIVGAILSSQCPYYRVLTSLGCLTRWWNRERVSFVDPVHISRIHGELHVYR